MHLHQKRIYLDIHDIHDYEDKLLSIKILVNTCFVLQKQNDFNKRKGSTEHYQEILRY